MPDGAFGTVIQLANVSSRPDGELGNNNNNSQHHHNPSDYTHQRGLKSRESEMSENPRSSKQIRMDNGAPHAGVDAQALSWAPTAPPAYPGHGLDQSGMPGLTHGDANAFDAAAHDVSAYGDASGVQNDQTRMAPPPPVANTASEQAKLTSEQTGLVGARGKTGMTRTLSTSRRAEQNRNAQRVFRERKNKYISDLESKAASLESALLAAEEHRRRFNEAIETIEILKRDNDTLRVALRALGGHQAVPSAPALPIDRPSHTPALLSTFHHQHAGAPAPPTRGTEHDDPAHAQGQPPTIHESTDHAAQDPATAAAVAAAASGGAPYWLLEAVSNANQQHGFHVPNHFSSQLADSGMTAGPHAHMHPNDPNAMRARGAIQPQRAEGMLDPSLEHATLGDASRAPGRVQGEENKGEGIDAAGNPDNLASLSAVAAAAAAAAASQKVNT